MNYLVGVDDTDTLESIGTGGLARELAGYLARDHGARLEGVTRHQLFVHPDIPYTSHNSSACLAIECALDVPALAAACRGFLEFLFHPGADPGLCIADPTKAAAKDIVGYGRRAQTQIVATAEAFDLARAASIHLEAIGGSGLGVIGAFCACGLRASRDDGRFIALPGARSIRGEITVGELRAKLGIDSVTDEAGDSVADGSMIETRGWVRPDLVSGRIVLAVQRSNGRYAIMRGGRGDEDK